MIYINEIDLKYPDFGLVKKIGIMKSPHLYWAESVGDYQDNAPNIKYHPLKKLLFSDIAVICLHDVGIRVAAVDYGSSYPNWFVVHDDTGQDFMYWDKDHFLLPADHSFNEAREEIGLEEDDWVYSILFGYRLDSGTPFIYRVRKNEFDNKELEENYLWDRVKNYVPENDPLPQPSY